MLYEKADWAELTHKASSMSESCVSFVASSKSGRASYNKIRISYFAIITEQQQQHQRQRQQQKGDAGRGGWWGWVGGWVGGNGAIFTPQDCWRQTVGWRGVWTHPDMWLHQFSVTTDVNDNSDSTNYLSPTAESNHTWNYDSVVSDYCSAVTNPIMILQQRVVTFFYAQSTSTVISATSKGKESNEECNNIK